MKIVFDARWIFPQLSGIGTYCRELLAAFHRLDTPHRFTVLFDDANQQDRIMDESGLRANPRFESRLVGWDLFSIRNQVLLGPLLKREGADLYHSPNYLIPLPAFPRRRPRRPALVVTLHDVIPLLLKDHAPRSRKSRLFWLYRWLMHETARRADAILCVSEAARTDCLRALAVPTQDHSRFRAVWNGVSPRFRPPSARRSVKAPDALRQVLYVGRFDPYKNLPALIRAFAILKRRAPFPVQLLIAGPPDPRYPEAPRLVSELALGPSVLWAGYLDDAALLKAYQESDLLVLPSRYEGFGLPVVEAMACGTPVVCGPATALREVAGDAALYGDPTDPEAFAHLLLQPLLDAALAARLSEAGRRRASLFHWDRTAAATLEVYTSTCPQSETPDS